VVLPMVRLDTASQHTLATPLVELTCCKMPCLHRWRDKLSGTGAADGDMGNDGAVLLPACETVL
jgi:hypothetical protein